ncbi:hypothetical protein DE146DRAFT_638333 [Phaeosphaeria sp. MPI-PUGE-AT-0046c]|nr:hypothetical protein DE146DRAFT_638333 [Phaeosphaeria sp. MPI-PUGE-AT-0046c]
MADRAHGTKLLTSTLVETSSEFSDTKGQQSSKTKTWSSRASRLIPRSWRRVWHTRFSGWRGGALVSLILCTLVLVVNILLLIIAAAAWHPKNGIATAFTGNCEVAARQLTVAHLFINLFSSLLLGASNYCMQRLAAPTRGEIDAAHAQKRVLDIGIPSVSNLFLIAPLRAFLWLLLGLSSIPLHFVYAFSTVSAAEIGLKLRSYNSVIFGTTSANEVSFTKTGSLEVMESLKHDFWNRDLYANISSGECNQRYYAQLFSNYGSGWGLLNISSMSNTTSTMTTNSTTKTGFGYLDYDNDYLYCISEKINPRCQVQLSLTIMGVVIVANIIKIVVISTTLCGLDNQTIITIGDAIQSFLREPDPTTTHNCLLSMTNIHSRWQSTTDTSALRWRQYFRPYWHTSCSPQRWVWSILLTLAVAIPTAVLVSLSQLVRRLRTGSGWNAFGRVSIDNFLRLGLLNGNNSIIPAVLVVNSPQVLISFLYLFYNSLFTCMLVGSEWSQYAVKRATLRVTLPTIHQRSTHFLELPYRWSIPLLIAHILLHWTISQSIFLVRIAFYKDRQPTIADVDLMMNHWKPKFVIGKPPEDLRTVFNGIGYSDTALLTSLVIMLALIIVCRLTAAFRTYDIGLPVGGTNSAVISAACHVMYGDVKREDDGIDIAEKPLQWGVTIRGNAETVGHLCFSDRVVEEPEFNCLYAGDERSAGLKA